MSNEKNVRDHVRLGASKEGGVLFANPSGKAWQGTAKRMPDGSILLKNPRRVAYGKGVPNGLKGSPDLDGWVIIIVTQEMVGKPLAVPLYIECKDGADVEPEQERWLTVLTKAGIRCGVACNEEDARRITKGEKKYDPKTDNKASSRNRARRAGTS